MRNLRGRFCLIIALGAMLLLLSSPLWGQENAPTLATNTPVSTPLPPAQGLPSTVPPPLLLVVIIDETATMLDGVCPDAASCKGGNAIDQLSLRETSPKPAPGSDPLGRRYEAVRRLIDLLNSDGYASHQLAVLAMDTSVDGGDWISSDGAGAARFVTLGKDANAAEVDTLKAEVITPERTETGTRGADSENAIKLAVSALNTQLSNDLQATRKPVILWLTDDVPLLDGGQAVTPYYSTNPERYNLAKWQEGITQKLTPAFNAAALPEFNPASHCRHNNGKLVTAVFALGAGNWINADGSQFTVQEKNLNEPFQLAEVGSFYASYATTNGWLRQDGTPLVWPIDPLFHGQAALDQDFRAAVSELVSDLRCTRLEVPANVSQQADKQVFTIPVSAAYRQVRITVNSASGVEKITNTTTEKPIEPPKSVGSSNYLIYNYRRDAANGANWAGDWQIVLNSSTDNLFVEYELDLAELHWSTDETRRYSRNTNIDYAINLYAASGTTTIPIQDETAFTLKGTLQQSGAVKLAQQPLTVNPSSGQFVLSIPQEQLSLGLFNLTFDLLPRFNLGSYQPDVPIAFPPDVPANAEFQLENEYGVEAREVDGNFDCKAGSELVGSELISAKVTLKRSGTSLVDLENLYAYVPVAAYLQVGTPTPRPFQLTATPGTPAPATPLAVLTYTFQGTDAPIFLGRINCADLPSSRDRQKLEVVAEVQGTPYKATLEFVYTASPIPPTVPTATPTPTFPPTATPAPFSSQEAVTKALDNPLAYALAAGIGISAAGWGLLFLVRGYDGSTLGLRGVAVRCDDEAFEVFLKAPWCWLPGQSARLIAIPWREDVDKEDTQQNPLPLLEIHSRTNRQALGIRNVVPGASPFEFNGQLLLPNYETELRQEKPELRLTFTPQNLPFTRYALETRARVLGSVEVQRVRVLAPTNRQAEPHLIVFHNPYATEG